MGRKKRAWTNKWTLVYHMEQAASSAERVGDFMRAGCTDEKVYLMLRLASPDYQTSKAPHWPLCIAAVRALWNLPCNQVTPELIQALHCASIIPPIAFAEVYEEETDSERVLGHVAIAAYLEKSKDWPSQAGTLLARERIAKQQQMFKQMAKKDHV